MRGFFALLLAAALIWLALEVPREQRELESVAVLLQTALEEDECCAAIFGLDGAHHRL